MYGKSKLKKYSEKLIEFMVLVFSEEAKIQK